MSNFIIDNRLVDSNNSQPAYRERYFKAVLWGFFFYLILGVGAYVALINLKDTITKELILKTLTGLSLLIYYTKNLSNMPLTISDSVTYIKEIIKNCIYSRWFFFFLVLVLINFLIINCDFLSNLALNNNPLVKDVVKVEELNPAHKALSVFNIFLSLAVFTPIAEEIFYRGYPFRLHMPNN